MDKYYELSAYMIECVGGKDNIIGVTHCLTRLRFTLSDYQLIQEDRLKEREGITTAQKAGGQYQVVIGTHVADVYEAVLEQIGTQKKEDNNDKKGILNSVLQTITKVITPVLGVLLACGLIQGVLTILTFTGLVGEADGAYVILDAMGQALFYFFPVILGYTSAKAFKLDPPIGMIIGAVLIFPNIAENLTQGEAMLTLFEGSILATPIYKTFFGIPIMFPAAGYGSTVIPIIFIVYFAAKLNRFLKKIIPAAIAYTILPFLTILISVPISMLIIGPITNILSELISAGVSALYGVSSVLTAAVVALIYQPLVILGLHWPLITIGLQNMAATGSDYIIPTIFSASFAQLAVVAAVYVRTRSSKLKGICIPAMISALFCIIEPAIYGVTLPVKKRFGFSMIGGAVGGVIMAVLSARAYAVVVGIFGFVAYINPETGSFSGVIASVISVLAAMTVAFLLTYFTFDKEEKEEEGTEASVRNVTIHSPLKGKVMSLDQARDSVFADGVLGKGVLIYPQGNQVIAPCDGKLSALFPTGHAMVITSIEGLEILIHIGKDTVQLDGKYFKSFYKQGDFIRKGDVLAEFDIQAIEAAGYTVETPVIISNPDMLSNFSFTDRESINYLEELITAQIQYEVVKQSVQETGGEII